MNCPKCGFGYSVVIESRSANPSLPAKRRRRKCSGCGTSFTTYELSSGHYCKMVSMIDTMKKIQKELEQINEN